MDQDLGDDMCAMLKRAAIWLEGYAHNDERIAELDALVERYEAAQKPRPFQMLLPFPPVSDGRTFDVFSEACYNSFSGAHGG